MQSFDRVPWDAGYVPSYLLTAVPNSVARRPVMKTYAPSPRKAFAVASPAVAAGDERDFSCKVAHGISPFFSVGSRRLRNVVNTRAPVSKPAQLTYAHMRVYKSICTFVKNEDERCRP
jgi:hypothetical protein